MFIASARRSGLLFSYARHQRRAIRREFEPIGPIMLKNHYGAGWVPLRWVASWLPIYLTNFFHQEERRFQYSIWKWVPPH